MSDVTDPFCLSDMAVSVYPWCGCLSAVSLLVTRPSACCQFADDAAVCPPTEELLWEETTDSIPSGARQAAQHFSELAAALARLAAAPGWSGAPLAGLLDQLLAAPQPWLAENAACLLLLAGERVAVPLLAAKARAGRTAEVARLLGAVCIMTHKFNVSSLRETGLASLSVIESTFTRLGTLIQITQ